MRQFSIHHALLVWFIASLSLPWTAAWNTPLAVRPGISRQFLSSRPSLALFLSDSQKSSRDSSQPESGANDSDSEQAERTSFDDAGRSLIEEQDQERMDQMGDFDSNPEYQTDNIEKMRAAIRARTESMGIEKSKVSADYIAAKTKAATAAGSASAASENSDMFGGLDLSQINSEKTISKSEWNEDLPSMFYDPESELSKEEQEQVDPVMSKNLVEQAMAEFSNAKWPDFASALREVGLMLVVIAVTGALIISWDKVLRGAYMSLGFIPTADDLANYASRFDGLDLPKGWMDNMNEQDVARIAEKVNTVTGSKSLPGL
ncbi:predicted protein [Phaeodactylum tricornutum CCAP 1055/1]|jgi:hypothetical protein|uniref:Uncharacterized protein n=3 Tax=Phaeodactylum tricornutum TaxID=2850 RepID=B7FU57_PHATC|nr:predicted protein [Phaeodactylum tricornutum CCAP 1055/1]EEC50205.1 predicted protein [Phaeodactylum tricornutum CCAP 1055/1]|eukprot:XP_002178540.1 predicted protein [Phaeodactylum tricornutum CCAP 1055/1]